MATYELHACAKQIQRSKGRSSVAAAAYRSATRMVDERTGDLHDYTPKKGVEHSRIYTPAHAPDWAKDRTKLWNACEVKENRSNSCTARELEVAFPSPFNALQRREAGDSIARELMRRYGCAVDISYHEPDRSGDERNFHAHLLFTTRAFDPESKDGWTAKKYRDLNNDRILVEERKTTRGKEEIKSLRAFTAHEMNRIAERDQLNVKTEHLSFEERGIDREASQHMGNTATQMERNKKASRIGGDNREIANDNQTRVQLYVEEFKLDQEIEQKTSNFRHWVAQKKQEMEDAQSLQTLDLAQKQAIQTTRLETSLHQRYGRAKATLHHEIGVIERNRAGQGLITHVLRNVFGYAQQDAKRGEEVKSTLKGIEGRENTQRGFLERQQKLDRIKANRQQKNRQERSNRAFEQREKQIKTKIRNKKKDNPAPLRIEQREKPVKQKNLEKQDGRPDFVLPKPLKSEFKEKVQEKGIVTAEKWKDRLISSERTSKASIDNKRSLTDQKNNPSEKPELGKHGSLSRPWEDSSRPWEDSSRPWDRELSNDNRNSPKRTRFPSPSPSRNGEDSS